MPILEIVSGLKKDSDYISCLFFYKDIPDFLSFVSGFGPSVCPYLSNRTRLDELIEYGFEIRSIGYVLKYDVVESLHDLLDNIVLATQKIEWSPFETAMQPFAQQHSAIESRNHECLEILINNGANINEILSSDVNYGIFYHHQFA